jgi:arylsulfatase A-like enzyme
MIRTEQYRLIHYPRLDRDPLFDLARDPNELDDLAGRPAYAKQQSELRAELDRWLRQRKGRRT